MTCTAWTNPSTAATGISGTVAWTNASNATADDAANATAAVTGFQTSEYLQLQGFGFAIPTGATIDSVEVQIDRSATGGGTVNLSDLQIMNGASGSAGSLKGDPDTWNGTNFWGGSGFQAFAGAGDTWSGYLASLTPAIVNSADFGVAIKATNVSGSTTIAVDIIQLKVCYTAADTSMHETDWLSPLRQPPIEEPATEFDQLSAQPVANLDPIVAAETDPSAGIDAACLALPPDFPIEELTELAWQPSWANLDPIPDIPEVPGAYVGLAMLSQPPEFPLEEIADLTPPPSLLRPEEVASIAGSASFLMVHDCPLIDPSPLVDNLGELAGRPAFNVNPLPDAAESFPGTAIVTRVGFGTALVVALQSGLQGDRGPYTAIVTRVGPGAAIVYRRSDP